MGPIHQTLLCAGADEGAATLPEEAGSVWIV